NLDTTSPRCKKEIENNKYWIICEANMITLDKIIRQAVDGYLSVIEGKKTRQMGDEQVQEYIKKYKMIYTSPESKLKIGIIMRKLHDPIGAINDQRHNMELHHNIISKLYTQIWIPSYQVRRENGREKIQ
ncbi:16346_t:CDS:1, partial [Gigaspora margarita]